MNAGSLINQNKGKSVKFIASLSMCKLLPM